MRSRDAWEWVNEPGISREERAKRKWLTFGFMPRPMRMVVVTNDSNPSRPDQKQSDDRERSGNHV